MSARAEVLVGGEYVLATSGYIGIATFVATHL
jgi:hypothetical protein